jgi:hypothetical protein
MGVRMLLIYILVKIILYILLVLLIIILAVLIIPFKYYFTGKKLESTSLEGTVSWLFGGLKMRFCYDSDSGYDLGVNFLGIKKKLKDNKKRSQSKNNIKNEETDNEKKKGQKPVYSYFTYEVLVKGLQSALKVLNHCKPSQFNLEAKGSFDEPMYTGLLFGIKNAGFAILDKYHIHLQPTFEDEEMKGSFKIGGSIQLFYLLLVAIEFVATNPLRSILLKNTKIKIKRRLKRWRIISISVKT